MAKLIFKYSNGWKQNVREANEIKFDVPDDMNMNEYKAVMIRLAHSLGYSPKSIQGSFGDLKDTRDNIKTLLKDIKENDKTN